MSYFENNIHKKNVELLKDVEPAILWYMFSHVCAIPHGSKNEGAIASFVMQMALKNDLENWQDKAGNVLVKIPAFPGKENLQSVCLQSHLDMVCEKTSESKHDFDFDPIRLIIKDDPLELNEKVITADGTTLGADNGIGVAIGLALMSDKTIQHGPLELLFTVDEETGLHGAGNLELEVVSKTILNLDSEDLGEFFVSSAGGQRTVGTLPLDFSHDKKESYVKIIVTGMKGGHSGVDINRFHENPIKIIGRLFCDSLQAIADLCLIEGGEKFNSIPRYAFMVLNVDNKNIPVVEQAIKDFTKILKLEIGSFEPNFEIKLEILPPETYHHSISFEVENLISCLISNIPHGVCRMSPEISDLVQTSTNFASIRTTETEIIFETMQRSSIDSEILNIGKSIKLLFESIGGKTENFDWVSGWKANPKSNILILASKIFKEIFNEEPKIKAIHAGLECGELCGKYPGVDVLSIGPSMKDVHTPDERVYISSVEIFWNFLIKILENMPEVE